VGRVADGTPLGLNPALYQKLDRRCVSAICKTEKSFGDRSQHAPEQIDLLGVSPAGLALQVRSTPSGALGVPQFVSGCGTLQDYGMLLKPH
jgi:hypothetical protein